MGIELFLNNDEIWYSDGDNVYPLDEKSELTRRIYNIIKDLYPDAYKSLMDEYAKSVYNVAYCQYLIVKRFCKCNFGMLDNTFIDLDGSGFNFEKVVCPLRGECKYDGVICQPKMTTKLSIAEKRVMEQVYYGKSVNEISSLLYISPNTVKNHIKSVYAKLGIHKVADFINYANKNNLFNH